MKTILILIFVAFSFNLTFGQTQDKKQIIEKFCKILNNERKTNEYISSMLYKVVSNVYPDSLVNYPFSPSASNFYNKKCSKLSSDKKILNGIWNHYLSSNLGDYMSTAFSQMGLPMTEAETLKDYIIAREFEKK